MVEAKLLYRVLLLVRRRRSVSTVLSPSAKRIRGRCLLIFIFLFGDSEYYKQTLGEDEGRTSRRLLFMYSCRELQL